MKGTLKIYDSLSRDKVEFKPMNEGFVGMYVCGPTVYNDVHLGNCRTFVSFDIIYRYLMYLGNKVRYVRNITDVGHLLDDGTDRMAKGAKTEQLEPMEVAQKYTNSFRAMMRTFNALEPSIEPTASGHVPEQIQMVQDILDNGYAYERNGSVYFNTRKFAEEKGIYGKLSGRKIEDLIAESRDNLKNQGEKDHPSDFAIWMKAAPEHIMRWQSPWSEGFPGWHLECSAMSTKYLGEEFDIHGGGNDLKFPHHENEIAQNAGSCNHTGARYWLHTNMLLMNGRKMSKSDGNTISPQQLFTGESDHISKGYSPMVVKFFMLQSHYRSTLDLTDEALQAAEKGYKRLMEAHRTLVGLSGASAKAETALDKEIKDLIQRLHEEMNDDFNTPKALAVLFEIVTKINSLKAGHLKIADLSPAVLAELKQIFHDFVFEIMALQDELSAEGRGGKEAELLDGIMQLVIEMRQDARTNKDWGTADKIRDTLKELNLVLKDGKDGTNWTIG